MAWSMEKYFDQHDFFALYIVIGWFALEFSIEKYLRYAEGSKMVISYGKITVKKNLQHLQKQIFKSDLCLIKERFGIK